MCEQCSVSKTKYEGITTNRSTDHSSFPCPERTTWHCFVGVFVGLLTLKPFYFSKPWPEEEIPEIFSKFLGKFSLDSQKNRPF
jgi:hypothetical protein